MHVPHRSNCSGVFRNALPLGNSCLEIAGCDDALIHESPILFLKSHIYIIAERYAYVEKFICGLQLSHESHCSHDTMIKNGTSNYFER
jgi:hypothetical protein